MKELLKKYNLKQSQFNYELWIQFNHYQDGERFYKYDTRGFTELFEKNCQNTN